jgi:Uma2 family endonuclease
MTEALFHSGPWTTADLAGLPDDGQRYEIIDGSLLVSPPPSPLHQLVAGRLVSFLRDAAPKGLDVVEAVGVRFGSGRLLIPDVVVASSAALLGGGPTIGPADVALVVEVVSPSNAEMDRVFKPQLYATGGIGWMWRAEFDTSGVEITVLELLGGVPVERIRSRRLLRVDAPYPVEIPVDRLLQAR